MSNNELFGGFEHVCICGDLPYIAQAIHFRPLASSITIIYLTYWLELIFDSLFMAIFFLPLFVLCADTTCIMYILFVFTFVVIVFVYY